MKEGELPKQFDPAIQTQLFLNKFFIWDEVHRQVIPGYDNGYVRTPYKDHIIKFPRDDNEKLDVSNEIY